MQGRFNKMSESADEKVENTDVYLMESSLLSNDPNQFEEGDSEKDEVTSLPDLEGQSNDSDSGVKNNESSQELGKIAVSTQMIAPLVYIDNAEYENDETNSENVSQFQEGCFNKELESNIARIDSLFMDFTDSELPINPEQSIVQYSNYVTIKPEPMKYESIDVERNGMCVEHEFSYLSTGEFSSGNPLKFSPESKFKHSNRTCIDSKSNDGLTTGGSDVESIISAATCLNNETNSLTSGTIEESVISESSPCNVSANNLHITIQESSVYSKITSTIYGEIHTPFTLKELAEICLWKYNIPILDAQDCRNSTALVRKSMHEVEEPHPLSPREKAELVHYHLPVHIQQKICISDIETWFRNGNWHTSLNALCITQTYDDILFYTSKKPVNLCVYYKSIVMGKHEIPADHPSLEWWKRNPSGEEIFVLENRNKNIWKKKPISIKCQSVTNVQNVNTIAGRNDKENKETVETMSDEQDLHKHSTDNRTGGNTSTSTSSDQIYLLVKSRNLVRKMYYSPESCQVSKILKTRTLKLLRGKNLSKQLMKKMVSVLTDEEKAVLLYHHLPHQQKQKLTLMNVYMGLKIGKNPMLNKAVKVLKTFLMSCLELGISLSQYYNVIVEKKIKVPAKHPVCYWWNRLTNKSLEIKDKPFNKKQFILEVLGLQPEKSALPQKVPLAETGPKTAEVKIIGSNIARMKHDILNGNIGVSEKLPMPPNRTNKWLAENFIISKGMRVLYISQLETKEILNPVLLEWANKASKFCINNCLPSGSGVAILQFVTNSDCFSAKKALSQALTANVIIPSKEQREDMYAQRILSYRLMQNESELRILVVGLPENRMEEDISALFPGAQTVISNSLWAQLNRPEEYLYIANGVQNLFLVEYDTVESANYALQFQNNLSDMMTVNRLDSFRRMYLHEYWNYIIATKSAQMKDIESERLLLTDKCRIEKCSEVQKELDVLESVIISDGITQEQLREKEILLRERATTLNGCIRCINIDTNRRCKQGLVFPESEDMMTSYTWRIHKLRESRKTLTLSDTELIQSKSMTVPRFRFERESQVSETNNTNKQVYEDKVEESSNQQNSLLLSVYNSKDNEISEDLEQNVNEEIMENVNMYSSVRDVISSKTTKNNPNNMMELERPGTDEPESESQLMSNVQHDHSKHKEMENITEKKTCVKNEDFQESQSNVHPVIFSPIIHSVMSCAKQSDFHDTFSSPFGANNPAPKQVQSSNGSDVLSTSLPLSQAHNQTTTKDVVSLKATKKEKTAKTFPFSKLCAEKNGVDSNTVLGENVADTSKDSQIVPTNYTLNLHECSEISVKKEPEVFEKQSPHVEHTGSLTEVQEHAVNTHLIQNTEEQIAQMNTKPCIDKTSEQSIKSYGHRDYKKLYIGGLPQIPNLQQELKNIFKGTKRIWIISKDNSRFAIADYKTESQCEKDYKSTQGAKLGDQRLTIKYKHKKSGNSNQTLENHLEICQNKDEGTSNMKNKLNCNVKFQGGNKGNSKTSALNKDKDQFLNGEVTKTNSKSNEEVLSNEKSAENLKQIKPKVESGHTGCLTEIKIEAENNDMIQDIEDQIGKLKKKRSLDTENSESMYKKAARYCKRFKYDDLDAPGKESKPNDFDPWDNVISFYTGQEGKRSLDKVNMENMHRKGESSNTEVIGKSSVQKVISHDDRVRDYTQLYIGRLPKIPNMSKELKEIFKGSNQLKIFNKQDSRFAFAKYKTEGQCKKDYESAKGTVLGNCLLTIDYGYKKSDNSKPSSCKSLETYQNKDNGTSNHIVSVNNNAIADVCSIRNTQIVSLKGLVERTSNSEENGSCNIYDGCDIRNTGTVALNKQGERTPHIKDNGSCNDIFEGCDIGNVEKTAFKGQSDYRQLCKEMTHSNSKGKEKLLSKVETAEKLKQIKAKMEEIKAKQDFKPQDEEYIIRQERKRKQLEVAILENTENIKLVNAMLTAARRENAMKAKQNKTATLGRSAQDNINLCHAKEPENQRPAQDNTNIQTEVRNIKVELEDGELEESDEEETIGRGLQSEHEVVKEKSFSELHTSNNENESNKQSLISITENATNSIKCRGTSNSVNSEEVIDLTSEHEYPSRKKKIFQAAHVEHEPKDYGKKPIKYMDLLREFRKTRERSSLFEDCQVAWEQTRKSSSLDNNIPRSYEKKSSKDHFQSVSSRTGNKNVTNQRKGSSECWKDANSDKLKCDEKLEQFIKKNERNKKSDLSQIIKKSESISSSNKCLSADDHKCYRSPYSQINNTSVSDNNDETKIKLVTMQEVPVRPVLPEQSTTQQSTVYKSPYDLCSQEETSVSPYTAAAVTSDVLKRMSEDETNTGSAKKIRFSQEPCPPVIHNSQTAETKCLEESDCNTDVQTILKSLQDTLGSKIEELQRVDSSGMLAGTQFHLLLESIGNIKKRYEVESTVGQDNDYGDNHIVHDELTFKAPTVPEVGRSADQLISSQNIHHYPMQYNERDSNLLIEQPDIRTFQNREESVLPGSSNQVPVIDNRCYQPMLNPPVDTISQLNQPPMNPSDLIQFSHQHVNLQVPNVPYFMEPSIQSNLLSSNIRDFNHLPLGKGTFQQEKPNYRTGHKDLKTCLNILRGSISTPPQEDFQMTGFNNVQTQLNQPGYPQLNLDLPTINLPFK